MKLLLSVGAALFAASLLAIASFGAEVRRVELVDFATRPGSFTNGAELPGAIVKGDFVGSPTAVKIEYDLTKGAYVGWTLAEKIPEGTSALEFRLTNLSDADMSFGFRFTDAKNQHYHGKLVGEKAKPGEKGVLFTASFAEHDKGWRRGGETDGQVHYPILNVTLMTCRGGGPSVGAFTIDSVKAVTTADAEVMPDYFLSVTPAAFGAVWYPGETCEFAVRLKSRSDKTVGGAVRWKLEDWFGVDVASGEVKDGIVRLSPSVFKGRVGSFRFRCGVRIGGTKLVRETWLARLTSKDVKPARWVGSLAPEWCYPLVQACGIGRLNTSTEWRISEKKKGEYQLDYLVDRCTNMLAYGIMPTVMIQSRNPLYEDEIDKEAFARWAVAVAKRLSSVGVDRIEIWNEPQNFEFRKYYGGGWGDDGWITKYIDFTRTVSKAIHEAVPEMTVSVAAEDIEWVLYAMLTRGIAQPWDQVSFHPYCHYQIRPEFAYFYCDRGEVIKSLAKNYGGAKRLGISEVGWTTVAGAGEYWEVAGCYPRASYKQQAMYLVRAYLLGVMCGADWTLQYRFDDSGPREEYTEHNFGMVRRDRTPKPSFAAVAFMTRTVGEFTKVEHLPGDLTLRRVGCFTMPDGRKVYAAWAVVNDFKWTVPGDRPFRVYDMMGNELMASADRALTLTERPVYVVER